MPVHLEENVDCQYQDAPPQGRRANTGSSGDRWGWCFLSVPSPSKEQDDKAMIYKRLGVFVRVFPLSQPWDKMGQGSY